MSEQVKRFRADLCVQPIEVVAATDYDALHAEAEALQRKVTELTNQRDAILLQARCWAGEAKAQQVITKAVGEALGGVPNWGAIAAGVEALRAEIEELDALRNRQSDLLSQTAIALRGPEPALTRYSHADIPSRVKTVVAELEAARGLLERVTTACTFEAYGKALHDARAFLTATPAPEVRPDLIRFDFINADGQQDSKMITHDDMRERYAALAEQGERQEAVAFRCKLSIHKDWKYIDHRAPDSFELRECEIQPLYTTPQPGPDVRGLVEALEHYAGCGKSGNVARVALTAWRKDHDS